MNFIINCDCTAEANAVADKLIANKIHVTFKGKRTLLFQAEFKELLPVVLGMQSEDGVVERIVDNLFDSIINS